MHTTLWRRLWTDERGLVLSAELIIIVTVVVLGLITGLACLQQAVIGELQDVGFALRGLNQSYATTSFLGCGKIWGRTSWTSGSRFTDFRNGFIPGDAVGVAEIGAGYGAGYGAGVRVGAGGQGQGGLILESPAASGCVTCPPDGTGTVPPTPVIECPGCVPDASPAHPKPQPEIPQGPAPQILPQT